MKYIKEYKAGCIACDHLDDLEDYLQEIFDKHHIRPYSIWEAVVGERDVHDDIDMGSMHPLDWAKYLRKDPFGSTLSHSKDPFYFKEMDAVGRHRIEIINLGNDGDIFNNIGDPLNILNDLQKMKTHLEKRLGASITLTTNSKPIRILITVDSVRAL